MAVAQPLKRQDVNIETVTESLYNIIEKCGIQDSIKRIGIFGSVARQEYTSESDIDFVVDYQFGEVCNIDAAMQVTKSWLKFNDLMREAYNPQELSIVSLCSLKDSGEVEILAEIERDVIWVYEGE